MDQFSTELVFVVFNPVVVFVLPVLLLKVLLFIPEVLFVVELLLLKVLLFPEVLFVLFVEFIVELMGIVEFTENCMY